VDVAYSGGGFTGYSGAVAFALAGKRVVIYDPDEKRVADINAGKVPVQGLESFLGFQPGYLVRDGWLRATTHHTEIESCLYHLFAVPTEKDGKPHVDTIRDALWRTIPTLPDGGVVIIESTLPPGEARYQLQWLQARGFPVNSDDPTRKRWHYAVAPRRDWFSNAEQTVQVTKRVVGGATPACAEKARALLSIVSRDIELAPLDVAELTKSIENAILMTLLTFQNELADVYPNVDVGRAVELAWTHARYRTPTFHLSAGVGGYCIPLACAYLQRSGIAEAVLRTNDAHTWNVAAILREWALAHAVPSVGLLGVAYRPDTRVHHLSPAIRIAEVLAGQHQRVIAPIPTVAHDPYFEVKELERILAQGTRCVTGLNWREVVRQSVVALLTPHRMYWDRDVIEEIQPGTHVLDAQGTWRHYRRYFAARHIHYRVLGEAGWTET
jgi:nucleotide sugar dehydrogenase